MRLNPWKPWTPLEPFGGQLPRFDRRQALRQLKVELVVGDTDLVYTVINMANGEKSRGHVLDF